MVFDLTNHNTRSRLELELEGVHFCVVVGTFQLPVSTIGCHAILWDSVSIYLSDIVIGGYGTES